MTWLKGAPQTPTSVEEWLILLERRLNAIQAAPSGAGRGGWSDVAGIGVNYQIYGSFPPGWRWLNDGRVELRGRLTRKAGAPSVDGDVIITLPYRCAPPNNEQLPPTSVSMSAVTGVTSGPGVVRLDVQREAEWKVDLEGNPISVTEVILRKPSGGFTDWIGLDHVTFDPSLYLEVLPPVPYGQKSLDGNTTIVVFQHPTGDIEVYPAGVQQPAGGALSDVVGDARGRRVFDPYGLLTPDNARRGTIDEGDSWWR